MQRYDYEPARHSYSLSSAPDATKNTYLIFDRDLGIGDPIALVNEATVAEKICKALNDA